MTEFAETINVHIADNFLGEGTGREELLQHLGNRNRYETPPREEDPQTLGDSPRKATEQLGATPFRCALEDFMDPDRTLESVRAYVIQDLADAAPTTAADWLELYLGVSPSTYREWRAKILEGHWFEDKGIQDALRDYCAATDERRRYDPFIKLLTRIIEMGRKVVHPLPDTGYPINNMKLHDHSGRYIHRTTEHGTKAAQRKPDIILLRESTQLKDGRAQWTDILTWFELKYIEELTGSLTSVQAARNISTGTKVAGVQGRSPAVAGVQV